MFGCVAAFVAADAAAKAANVTDLSPLIKTNLPMRTALPVPLITCLKIRGSVADVEAAMDAAAAAAESIDWCGIHVISSPVPSEDTEKMLRISATDNCACTCQAGYM